MVPVCVDLFAQLSGVASFALLLLSATVCNHVTIPTISAFVQSRAHISNSQVTVPISQCVSQSRVTASKSRVLTYPLQTGTTESLLLLG